MKPLFFTVCLALALLSIKTQAAVTYATCPTLQPQLIYNFTPQAMQPIYTAVNTFEVGMNQTIANAASVAANIQMEAATNSMNSIMKAMIETSQLSKQQEIEMTREYEKFKMQYQMRLEKEKAELRTMLFPGDVAMLQPKDNETRAPIETDTPSFKMIKQVCTAGKMQEMAFSEKVDERLTNSTFRRGQKITQAIASASSTNSAAKRTIDMHYELFCSENDAMLGLCDAPSATPNADLQALTLFYPQGYKELGGQNSDYYTMYTYSPVESLASMHFIQHVTGQLGVAPPSLTERADPSRSTFVALHKQLLSALGVASATLLDIAELREPINGDGVIMSQLDSINFLIEESKKPSYRRTIMAASDNGKMLEMQKQLNIQARLRLLGLKQKDNQRLLKATETAIQNTIDAFTR